MLEYNPDTGMFRHVDTHEAASAVYQLAKLAYH